MDDALQFYRRTLFNKMFAPHKRDSPTKIADKYAHHVQNITAFERAFKPVLKKAIDAERTIYNRAAVILTLC
jgi:hypothetical protein